MVNASFEVMCHHLFIGVAVAVEVVDQGIYRGQPCLGEHRVGTVALAHVAEPLAHRFVVKQEASTVAMRNTDMMCMMNFIMVNAQ